MHPHEQLVVCDFGVWDVVAKTWMGVEAVEGEGSHSSPFVGTPIMPDRWFSVLSWALLLSRNRLILLQIAELHREARCGYF